MTALLARFPQRWTRPALLAVLWCASVAPFVMVDIPALADYPNHLARMSVLARAGTGSANPFYEVAWGFYPNLAMDLVVPPAARWIGVEAATKAFLILCLGLVVSGAVALEWSARRRFGPAGFAALLLLFATPFASGFMNFTFAFGVALWAVATWLGLAHGPVARRIAVHAAFVAILYVGHLFALGLYGLTIGIVELRRVVRERAGIRRSAGLAALMAAPVLALWSIQAVSGGSVGGSGTRWSLAAKVLNLTCINGFSLWAAIATTAILAVVLHRLAKAGHIGLDGDGRWLLAGFALTYLAMPFRLFDIAFLDVRVLVAATVILPAFATVRMPGRREAWIAGCALAAIWLVNLAAAARVQGLYATEYAAILRSFDVLRPGPRILVAFSRDGLDPQHDRSDFPVTHAPVLAVHAVDAFVPTLFALAGSQPVRPKPAFRDLSAAWSEIPTLDDLMRWAGPDQPPSALADWARTFDYLYVVGPIVPNPRPGLLHLAAQGRRFTAYRIGPDPAPSNPTASRP